MVAWFETSGVGYGMVTLDFDCQGLSAGVLQWNVGKGSLWHKLLSKVPAETFAVFMPTYGPDFRAALAKSKAEGLEYVRGFQTFANKKSCIGAESEGAELLEKITGTEIYAAISVRVHDGTDARRRIVEQLEQRRKEFVLHNDEARQTLLDEQRQFASTIAQKDAERSQRSERLDPFQARHCRPQGPRTG